MSFAPTSPVTGAPVAGFTTPTYTLTLDTAPVVNGKQYAVTALGGTQAGVSVHSVSKPFTFTMFRPVQPRALPVANPLTGIVKNIPVNTYKYIGRKGALPAANQAPQVPLMSTAFNVPAGTDSYEPAELKALVSCGIGILWQQSSGIADLIITGIL